jgi:hypothetical protein
MKRRTLIRFIERVFVAASAGAFTLQRLIPANDTECVVVGVLTKAAAHGAPLDQAHRSRSQSAGSIAGPPWRTSK